MEVSTPLLSAFSALLGAWAGAQVALYRFKRERAFDRRIDWHERVFRALYSLAIALEGALHAEAREQREEAEAYWAKAWGLFDPLSAVCAERELYAKPKGHAALERLVSEVNIILAFPYQRQADPVLSKVDSAKTVVQLLREAAVILSSEVRPDLGWPVIESRSSHGVELGA